MSPNPPPPRAQRILFVISKVGSQHFHVSDVLFLVLHKAVFKRHPSTQSSKLCLGIYISAPQSPGLVLLFSQKSTSTCDIDRKMFTPVEATIGALLLSQATTTLLLNNGRILGASSLIAGSVSAPGLNNIPILAGIGLSAGFVTFFVPWLLPNYDNVVEIFGSWTWILSGLVVGMGTKVFPSVHSVQVFFSW